MPRVNRDLQRRMAARRDRERRQAPSERRYRFVSPAASGAVVDGQPAHTTIVASTVAPVAEAVHAAHRPFSAYRAEYAYVLNDLRRVGLVIGSLLLILIALYFVLAR